MDLTAPDWLTLREGLLQRGSDKRTWFVILHQQAQYALVAVPVEGNFGCCITQTINSNRIESNGTYAKADDAIRGGLEDLRKSLGW